MSRGQGLRTGLQSVGVALAVIAAVWLWGQCQYTAGAKEAQLRAAGDSTDRWRARHIGEDLAREMQVRRDSAAAAAGIRAASDSVVAARRISDSLAAALRERPGDLLPRAAVEATLAAKDATIARERARADSLDRSSRFWQAVAGDRAKSLGEVSRQRDEYKAQRDAWQKRAISRCGAAVGGGRGLNSGVWDAWVGVDCRVPLPRIPFPF